MKVREPVERPLDVVIVELLLSASQAYVSGVLMYLAVGLWTDRGVGLGPVAVILGVLSVGVGAAWLFWLLGGTGWPLAAASVPVAMFAGFALVLGTQGDGLIRLEPIPLLLLVAASAYGIIGGVFLDSPRRWRWDQRQTLRPGTKVPRVSPTTVALAAKMPRTLPKRSTATEPGWPEPPEPGAPVSDAPLATGSAIPATRPDGPGDDEPLPASVSSTDATLPVSASTPDTIDEQMLPPGSAGAATGAPAEGSERAATTAETPLAATEDDNAPARGSDGSIELPTSIEPRSQRSPWAWAAPPEWSREDEDDDDAPDRGTAAKS